MSELTSVIWGHYVKCLLGTSMIAIIILLFRALLGKKLSKRFSYALWIVIPIYMLLVPWLKIPMPQVLATLGQETLEKVDGEIRTIIIPAEEFAENSGIFEKRIDEQSKETSNIVQMQKEEEFTKESKKFNVLKPLIILKYGYIAVVIAIIVSIVSTNVRFEYRCRHSRVYLRETPGSKLPVYGLGQISSPFLLCATMYVPDNMTEDELRYAMLHEEGHFKHGDFLWVTLRYLILAVFFYNPIIWLAFRYSGYDCELACDESVMHRIQKEERKAYGGCLLDVIKKNRGMGERVLLSTNMKSGKKLIRARIENIVAGYRNNIILMGMTTAFIILVSGCSLMEQQTVTQNDMKAETLSVESQVIPGNEVSETQQGEQVLVQIPFPTDTEGAPEGIAIDAESTDIEKQEGVVALGDTIYFCTEVLKKCTDSEGCYEGVEDKQELSIKIDDDVISFEQKGLRAQEMVSYVAKEVIGKKVGDMIQLIREVQGEEYHYYYLITAMNKGGDPDYKIPENWDYQFPEPIVGSFYQNQSGEPDFGFDGREIETGCFFVPYMREYYTNAMASSYLEAVGTNTYKPDNLLSLQKEDAWAEGVKGTGIGEEVVLKQMYMGPGAERLTFTRFCIVNGYAKDAKLWEKNARVKELKVYYADAYMGSIQLKDCMEPQYIDVSALNMTIGNGREAVFRFEIGDVYPGTKYEDTCLTGIEIEFSR